MACCPSSECAVALLDLSPSRPWAAKVLGLAAEGRVQAAVREAGEAPVQWEALVAEGLRPADLWAAPPALLLARVQTARGGALRWTHLTRLDPNLRVVDLLRWGDALQPWMAPFLGATPAQARAQGATPEEMQFLFGLQHDYPAAPSHAASGDGSERRQGHRQPLRL